MKKLTFGVAGGIASGKSTFCRNLKSYLEDNDIPCHWIEVDLIRRHILYGSRSENHLKARTALVRSFDLEETPDNFVPADFGKMIFSSKRKMEIYKELINPELIEALKHEISSLDGVILLEWAMLIEDGMLTLTDNNVILMEYDEPIQLSRLQDGGLSKDEIRNRIAFTAGRGFSRREKIIRKTQKEKGSGTYIKIKTDSTETELKKTFDFILSSFDHENF